MIEGEKFKRTPGLVTRQRDADNRAAIEDANREALLAKRRIRNAADAEKVAKQEAERAAAAEAEAARLLAASISRLYASRSEDFLGVAAELRRLTAENVKLVARVEALEGRA